MGANKNWGTPSRPVIGGRNACDKVAFFHRKDARSAAKKHHHNGLRAYRCPVCDLWHLGHTPSPVRKGDMTATEIFGHLHALGGHVSGRKISVIVHGEPNGDLGQAAVEPNTGGRQTLWVLTAKDTFPAFVTLSADAATEIASHLLPGTRPTVDQIMTMVDCYARDLPELLDPESVRGRIVEALRQLGAREGESGKGG